MTALWEMRTPDSSASGQDAHRQCHSFTFSAYTMTCHETSITHPHPALLLTSIMLLSAVLGTTMKRRDRGGMLSGSAANSISGCLLKVPDRLRPVVQLPDNAGEMIQLKSSQQHASTGKSEPQLRIMPDPSRGVVQYMQLSDWKLMKAFDMIS